MYTQRVLLYPGLGKGPELRALVEEHVKTRQAKGLAIALAAQVLAGAGGAAYVFNIRHQDLAAFDAVRRQNMSDPEFQAFNTKLATLLSRPLAAELYEVLIPFPATPAVKAPYYVQRALTFPAVGKGPELRPLVEERVKSQQSAGQRASLSTSVYGTEGPTFATALSFQNLAALESYRTRNQADPAFQAFGAKMSALVRQAPKVELAEVLIAIPS